MSPGRVLLMFGGVAVPLTVTTSPDCATVQVRDTLLTLTLDPLATGVYAVMCNGRHVIAHYATDGHTHYLHVDGETYAFERGAADGARRPADDARRAVSAGHHDLRAPMPGVVTQVFVQEGQAVLSGDPLYAVEAMKVETVVRAASPGRIGRLRVTPGTQVEGGAVVVEVDHVDG